MPRYNLSSGLLPEGVKYYKVLVINSESELPILYLLAAEKQIRRPLLGFFYRISWSSLGS